MLTIYLPGKDSIKGHIQTPVTWPFISPVKVYRDDFSVVLCFKQQLKPCQVQWNCESVSVILQVTWWNLVWKVFRQLWPLFFNKNEFKLEQIQGKTTSMTQTMNDNSRRNLKAQITQVSLIKPEKAFVFTCDFTL